MPAEGQELAIACAKAAEEILAEDIRILDLQGISSLTDFMVVCSGTSMPHLKAILRDVEGHVKEMDRSDATSIRTVGPTAAGWCSITWM